jgi:purine-binding chemotaxis protein CheW
MENYMNEAKHNDSEAEELLQLVSFRIGSEEYGVEILNVQEIIKLNIITRIPNAPDFVEGVINLRGRVIPVIDLRKRLGLIKKETDKDTRIIISEIDKSTVGFIVDAVSEVIRIPINVTEAPPEIAAGIESNFIKSVGKLKDSLLILIDLHKMLAINELDKLGTAA